MKKKKYARKQNNLAVLVFCVLLIVAGIIAATTLIDCAPDTGPAPTDGEPDPSESPPVSPSASAPVSHSPSSSPDDDKDDSDDIDDIDVVFTPDITVDENFVSDTMTGEDGDILVTYTSALPRIPDDGNTGSAIINGFYNDLQADFTYYARTELADVARANLYSFHELGIPYTPCSASQNYTVQYSKNGYISISRTINAYLGSSRVDESSAAETFRISDGTRVSLSDLFTVGQNEYAPRIHKLIIGKIEAQGGTSVGYYENYTDYVSDFFDQTDFYITNDGVAFIYPPITIAPSMLGVRVFEIPRENLDDVIDMSFWG